MEMEEPATPTPLCPIGHLELLPPYQHHLAKLREAGKDGGSGARGGGRRAAVGGWQSIN